MPMDREHSSHAHDRLWAAASDANVAAVLPRDQARLLRTSSRRLCAAAQLVRQSFNWFHDGCIAPRRLDRAAPGTLPLHPRRNVWSGRKAGCRWICAWTGR